MSWRGIDFAKPDIDNCHLGNLEHSGAMSNLLEMVHFTVLQYIYIYTHLHIENLAVDLWRGFSNFEDTHAHVYRLLTSFNKIF